MASYEPVLCDGCHHYGGFHTALYRVTVVERKVSLPEPWGCVDVF